MTSETDIAASSVSPKRRLSRRKRAVFATLVAMGVWGVIEGLSYLVLLASGTQFEWADLESRQHLIASGATTQAEAQETIHPYHGWAFNPQVSQGVLFDGRKIPVNAWGLVDDGPGVLKKQDGKLIVGIAGGSVAWQMSVAGESTLKERLAQKLGRVSQDIQLVRMAMSGFKQPQQLMTLSWLLTQGAEFDVVVNVDGFNEAVGSDENRRARVCMAYPTNWSARTQDIVDPREYSMAYELLRLRADRQQIAIAALSSLWRWSPTYQMVWFFRDRQIQSRRVELGKLILAGHHEVGGKSFANAGPAEDIANNAESDGLAVQAWANSTKQMASLCRGANCRYLHVLQPNQYVPNSKVFTPKEQADYVGPELPHAILVQRLFPQFKARGQELNESGLLRFRDLTPLFSDVTETIYADVWCHYNSHGNRLLAEAIADEIANALSDSEKP